MPIPMCGKENVTPTNHPTCSHHVDRCFWVSLLRLTINDISEASIYTSSMWPICILYLHTDVNTTTSAFVFLNSNMTNSSCFVNLTFLLTLSKEINYFPSCPIREHISCAQLQSESPAKPDRLRDDFCRVSVGQLVFKSFLKSKTWLMLFGLFVCLFGWFVVCLFVCLFVCWFVLVCVGLVWCALVLVLVCFVRSFSSKWDLSGFIGWNYFWGTPKSPVIRWNIISPFTGVK